jgi:Bacterial regulatory protein, arsR family
LTEEATSLRRLPIPRRYAILATVARSEHEVCVCDFTSGLDLNQSTVFHHLKLLKDAGPHHVSAPRHVGLLFPALDVRVFAWTQRSHPSSP